MRHIATSLVAGLVAAIVLVSTHLGAPLARAERADVDPIYLRETVLELDPATVRGWAHSKHGEEIVLPWFDGSMLSATTDRVATVGDFVNVFATISGDAFGSVVLTVGAETLVGAIHVVGETYRLRSLGDDAYRLAEVDDRRFNQVQPDTDGADRRVRRNRGMPRRGRSPAAAAALPPRVLRRILTAEIARDRSFEVLVDDGSTVDVFVAYSEEAADWATGRGFNLQAEINNMIADTNNTFAVSGIQPRLNLVGTAEIAYTVQDSTLETDLHSLQDGIGILGDLHVLRDQHSADIVSLLVLNGEESCGIDNGRACGWAGRPRRFPFPGELPGSATWNADFEDKGFSVVHIPGAFNGHTFKHETGHNFGAHHDVYTFVTTVPQPGPTADVFARGWVLYERHVRTVMSYNRLCALDNDRYCPILPRFSNPTQILQVQLPNVPPETFRLGDPAPGESPSFLGPADNVRAINNMAWTAANYRNSFAP